MGGPMIRRSQRIDFLLDEETEKGHRNEDLAEEALRILVETGHVCHFLRAEKESEMDRHGIDFLVWPEPDWTIPLQIKSSRLGREKHLLRYGEWVPCCVVVRAYDTPIELAQKILEELGLSPEFLEKSVQDILEEMRLYRMLA